MSAGVEKSTQGSTPSGVTLSLSAGKFPSSSVEFVTALLKDEITSSAIYGVVDIILRLAMLIWSTTFSSLY
jgi:hypothetical protein